MREIVVKIAHQIKPLLYWYSKDLLCYTFFDAVCHYQNQKRLFLYVVAAVFGGYFSIRRSRHSAKLYYQPHIFANMQLKCVIRIASHTPYQQFWFYAFLLCLHKVWKNRICHTFPQFQSNTGKKITGTHFFVNPGFSLDCFLQSLFLFQSVSQIFKIGKCQSIWILSLFNYWICLFINI